ncbi:putative ferric reductase transmembrane component [Candida viswanathii]|uniref:ferric-chelate reductase (NADPH) n=1 Tax=Candida viswanathii TaxID=5486 RepID=A0A367YH56_9ASCO|nr:putative ferric reductase transmembrane component [Candida viswanathii]
MKFIYYYLLTAFFAATVAAVGKQPKGAPYTLYRPAMGFYVCDFEIPKSVTYCKRGDYSCLCSDKNSLATFAGCLAYGHRNTTGSLKVFAETCAKTGNVTLPEGWFEESYKYYLGNAKSANEIQGFNRSRPIKVPFKLPPVQMELYQQAYSKYLTNFDDSLYYSAAVLAYWLLVMIIYGISHWTKFLFPGFTKKLTYGPINFWRKYIFRPATFKRKKAQSQSFLVLFDFIIPSRFETLVIALFYGLVILTNAIRTGHIKNDPVYPSSYTAKLTYVSDRTGIIATMMLPLIILFAGRNNFLQWLTGINFGTFITFHRHIARVMFSLVIVHAVTYTILLKGRYTREIQDEYLYWGIIATVAGGVIWIQGMLFFRKRWYEIFLLIHIIMAALFVAGTWIHVDILGYIYFVYPAVAVWCFDRVVRISRLILFGLPKAQVTLLANETLRVVIPKPSYWKSIPGGHAFIYFFRPTHFWQSHPFTFVDTPDDKSIQLYCRVKGGVTHSLYRMLANLPGRTAKIRVTVEGPYGEPSAAKFSDSAVFIAGGNGIPGIYSEVMDIARRLPADTKKVLSLVWVIRDYPSLTWFHSELEALKNISIQTTVYVTRPTSSVSDTNSEDKKVETQENDTGSESLMSGLEHIEFREGRPSIGDIVADAVSESPGSVAFVTCGHPVMVDEVRYYACANIGNVEGKRVDYFEQLQTWT